MDDEKQAWIRFELRQSLRALAASGDVALACIPHGAAKADELALELDQSLRASGEWLEQECGPQQGDALRAIAAGGAQKHGPHSSGCSR